MSGLDPAQVAAALAQWGGANETNPIEAVMWRAEAEPRLRSTVLTIEILDRAPDWDRLLQAHEWAVAAVPRARQRIVEPPLGLGLPMWVDDDQFDLLYHVRRMSLPGEGSMRQLLDLARNIGMSPFDRTRPPWELTLVEGLEGGRAAFISKLHHSAMDGQGGMQLIALGRSTTRDHTPDKPIAADQPVHPAPSTVDLVSGQLWRAARSVPGVLRRGAEEAFTLGRQVVSDPVTPVEEALRQAESYRRVLGPLPAAGSPLLRGRSASWHFEAHEVPLADIRAAGKAAGGSVNDVYIAALLGAFRRYHEHFGVEVDALPMAFPISLRRGDDPMGGNRFAGARLAGPMGEADPRERIRLVREAVLTARAEPAVGAVDKLSSLLAWAPTPVITRVLLEIGQDHDLQASNVPGVPYPIYLAGAQVLRMFPFGPLPGAAAMITMLSHAGTCCIGVNVDPAAVTDPGLFAQCLVEGFDEVLALKG
jgi:WS/DGAT/MGAT family acyltransferase